MINTGIPYIVGQLTPVVPDVPRQKWLKIMKDSTTGLHCAFNERTSRYYPLSTPSDKNSGAVKRHNI